ncbi:class I SAM-dependent methyltransferase [Tessaracoccus palaemonis]|uniref:Class I SAM-dependent methyltransferase n=1 Tax=Tessaracoccus palaemonis TaxID=2829499 RepID=A0ABX8SKX4_9ACTN|nr:class I SAM-dependent methyltransferase [Tessaracoccus palaemonis]QXT63594.1 class I SAM-dependent methyltransferase [Tessaracoccus palaemonis]
MTEPDPTSLAAGERLRRSFPADDVAWALSQVSLRRQGAAKLERAADMLFTRAGLEQATRTPVARWRAARLAAAGVTEVWDLGCGIGADAMAFAAAGLRVVGVEADEATAEIARHNLSLVGGGDVRVGYAEDAEVPAGAAVFLDPARRTGRGRTWNVADFTPPWEFVTAQLASDRFVAVKLGPGVPRELIPGGVEACWVSESGDTVEACLWNAVGAGTRAVVLPAGVELTTPAVPRTLDVRPVGEFLLEPDGAVIRAGLLAEIAPEADLWLLDAHTAYLGADRPIATPYATCFGVREVLDYDVRVLRTWVRERRIGTLEIKKRGLDVDPAQLRASLKPKGPGAATLILARTLDGARAIVAERLR